MASEADHVNFTLYESMTTILSDIHWEKTNMILEDLASVKDNTELDAIRTAVEITDKVYEEILPMLRPGYTEKQVANTMVSKYKEYGDGEAYSPIVATGSNGALPHAIPTDREFQKGDFIVIDAAAKYAGYHADMTRTPVVGEATDKHHEIYAIVKEAQQQVVILQKQESLAGLLMLQLEIILRRWVTENIILMGLGMV